METTEKTLTEILGDLEAKGYTFDFGKESNEDFLRKVTKAHKRYDNVKRPGEPEEQEMIDLFVREYHRLEGMSDPSENCIIYALETPKGVKGYLINAYGVYNEPSQVEKEAVCPQEVSPEQAYDNSK